MERYLTGLLTEHPVKKCDTLAAIHRQVVNRLREAALLEFIRRHQSLI